MSKNSLGIIGGGQLGSLLCAAAKKINIKTVVISDDEESPAKNFADHFIYSKYDNDEKLNEFVSMVDIITFEFENIPFEVLSKLNKRKKVEPNPEINKIVQHRYFEKNFLLENNIRTTKFKNVKNENDIKNNKDLLPGILKTSTLGYDGKGQYKLENLEELNDIKINYNREYILEKLVDLDREISVVITRYSKNNYEIYEPIENLHEQQILRYSTIPAKINSDLFEKSQGWAKLISERLEYVGTLCVEFFIDKEKKLYVNEIAPRVHNSGHLTINTHNICQFENHIRAICGLEKIKLKKLCNAKMINIIGNEIENYRNKKYNKNEFFFDYLKKNIKSKRKMGHLTIIEDK